MVTSVAAVVATPGATDVNFVTIPGVKVVDFGGCSSCCFSRHSSGAPVVALVVTTVVAAVVALVVNPVGTAVVAW